jgi:hypothetical protein
LHNRKLFPAHPTHGHDTAFLDRSVNVLIKKKQLKQQHRYGLILGFACLMPDCWLEVSLHPEGPATGHLDQGFLWFSSILQQMLSWYPDSELPLRASHAALPKVTSKFRSNAALRTLISKFRQYVVQPPAQLFSPHKKVHFLSIYLLHFLTLYLLSTVQVPVGSEGKAWELSRQEYCSCFPG